MRSRLGLIFCTLTLAVGGLVASLLTAPAGAADGPGGSPVEGPRGRSSEAAAAALAEVERLLAPAPAYAAPRSMSDGMSGATHRGGAELTMALRDLQLLRPELAGEDAATAAALLARPGATRSRTFGPVRVHWAASGPVRPAYLAKVGKIARKVLTTYRKAGYRTPKSDGTTGGGKGLLDIYLEDLPDYLYGYCNTDAPPPRTGPYATSAFCGFNTDFSWAPGDSNAVLRATIAHELFHAVQFGYDYYEDRWFMEATATWAEDEVFTGANDNRQYLRESSLSQPWISLDRHEGLRMYGNWIFFRYLTERFPKAKAGMPTLMRQIWRRADSVKGYDDSSIHAVAHALRKRGSSLADAFVRFADANRRPVRAYSEGRHYPQAPLQRRDTLSEAAPGSGWRSARLDHLSSATYRYQPGQGVDAKRWRLRIDLDLPRPAGAGAAALVTTYRTNGKLQRSVVKLSKAGNARLRVPFGSRKVKAVEVTLANTSTAFTCWQSTTYSCQGTARWDGDRWHGKVRARAIQR